MRIILRIMRKSIPEALFPKTRQAILTTLLLHPEKWWYMSDIAKHIGVSVSTLQRELASLVAADILESRKEGNRVYYKAQQSNPVMKELQSLLLKTTGLKDVVEKGLQKFLNKAEFVFIYGSMARNEQISTSDVDLFIIGDVKMIDMATAIKKLEAKLGREVNPTIYSLSEYIKKAASGEGFIKTLMADKKIFIKGTNDELKALAG